MSDLTDSSTFIPVQTVELSDDGIFTDYTVAFTATTTNQYVAFKHGLGGEYIYINIDNVVWEPIPSVVPGCVEDLNVTVNEDCGNFASLFEWTAVDGADGYKVSLGTTSGGTDIINNQNVGNITAVTFTGDFNTTYYYTLTPYNTVGDAVGCAGGSFSTAATGCHCTSVPTSLDGLGITNIQLGDTDFPNEDETYTDNTELGNIAITQGQDTNLQITFDTQGSGTSSYGYDVHVWIDFNDDYVFEESERVFTGESSASSPTTLDATFMVPAEATVGVHRMRIGTADGGQSDPDPCYSGSYGVTVDFNVNVEEGLSINEFDTANFRVYPNPVKDIMKLSYTQNITTVSVFNMLGQEVIAMTVNATEGQLDMSNLASGAYLVKVASENQIKTVKVIKQ